MSNFVVLTPNGFGFIKINCTQEEVSTAYPMCQIYEIVDEELARIKLEQEWRAKE